MSAISPQELVARRGTGSLVLIDVRSPGEYRTLHAEGATSVPLDLLDAGVLQPGPVYLICETGARAKKGAEKLIAAGRDDVHVVDGGTERWAQAGLPVVRGKGPISLFRQIRIVAGFLVLTGLALGWFVHPYLYGLSALVGTGLFFSGILDICPMGAVLSRLPWNKSCS